VLIFTNLAQLHTLLITATADDATIDINIIMLDSCT